MRSDSVPRRSRGDAICRNHLPRQAVRLASARKALDGERRLFSRGATDTAVYLKALREIGVGTIDIGFERIAAEPSLAEIRWFRGGLLLDTGALNL